MPNSNQITVKPMEYSSRKEDGKFTFEEISSEMQMGCMMQAMPSLPHLRTVARAPIAHPMCWPRVDGRNAKINSLRLKGISFLQPPTTSD